MVKNLALGFLLVFVSCSLLEYLEHQLVLAPIYASMRSLLLPADETRVGIVVLSYAVFAFFFTLIFSIGYKGRGLMEGIRYGIYISFVTSFPYAYLAYATTPIPHSLALLRTVIGIIQNVTYGLILAYVFGKTRVDTEEVQLNPRGLKKILS